MTNALDVKNVVVPLDAASWAGDDITQRVLRAPDDSLGGGLTILSAYIVNEAATTSGTAHSWTLQNFGTAGTAIKSSGGTIAATIGGTADVFAAGTPKSFTIASAYVDGGEWVVLRKDEDNSSDPVRGVLVIQYVMGR